MKTQRNHQPYVLSHSERSEIAKKHEVFSGITMDFPLARGFQVSQIERERIRSEIFRGELTYGEIDFVSLAELLFMLKNRYLLPQGGVFYDLGSGSGKCVVAASLLHNFAECIGIEVLATLHSLANQLKSKVTHRELLTRIRYVHSNILTHNWTNASVVFVNSTCFTSRTLAKVSNKEVRPGTISISLTHKLSPLRWTVLEKIQKEMSWGTATVYIQRRTNKRY